MSCGPAASYILAACLACTGSLSLAAETGRCSSDWMCIDALAQADTVELKAANLSDVPITFTLRVRTRDMTVDRPATITETLEPKQNRVVMVLTRAARAMSRNRTWFVRSTDIGVPFVCRNVLPVELLIEMHEVGS